MILFENSLSIKILDFILQVQDAIWTCKLTCRGLNNLKPRKGDVMSAKHDFKLMLKIRPLELQRSVKSESIGDDIRSLPNSDTHGFRSVDLLRICLKSNSEFKNANEVLI